MKKYNFDNVDDKLRKHTFEQKEEVKTLVGYNYPGQNPTRVVHLANGDVAPATIKITGITGRPT